MEIASLQFDMYGLFDRTGEGVMFNYEVHFDFDDMMKNGIKESNFIIVPIGFDANDTRYLNSIRASIDAWIADAKENLESDNFFEAKEPFQNWLEKNASKERNEAFEKLV